MGRRGLLVLLVVGFATFGTGGWWLSRAAGRNLHTVGTILFVFGVVVILAFPIALIALAANIQRRRALFYRPPPDGPQADYYDPPEPH
jgi:apolipoprotein N-acyltransferase